MKQFFTQILLLASFLVPLHAQGTSEIAGTVTDPTKAIISGATISIVNPERTYNAQ